MLIILDGWGITQDPKVSAIYQGKTPFFDSLIKNYPNASLRADGLNVGLPEGQMGNSEVGHMNLGAGRIVYQDFVKINNAVENGSLANEKPLVDAFTYAKENNKKVHLLGLLSDGGVHSHIKHTKGLIKAAKNFGLTDVYLHAFTDGRDVDPKSGKGFIADIVKYMDQTTGKLATVCGRYYAMDRDQRWDRVEAAYNLMVTGESEFQYNNGLDALNAAYARDENDEFVKASAILDAQGETIKINDGDALIFMNFRADRARQFTRCFTDENFNDFTRKSKPALADFVMLTQYAADINAPSAYPPEPLINVMGEWLEKHNKTQLRISETEKYAHVTFFFSGGKEDTFEGEKRILVPSPQVATYDLQPEMNSVLLTDKLVAAIESGEHDFIVCNYPNGDMVGHTGVFKAVTDSMEAMDTQIARLKESVEKVGGVLILTADHGNADDMFEHKKTGEVSMENNVPKAKTAHSLNPVPCIIFDPTYNGEYKKDLKEGLGISSLTATIINFLGFEAPEDYDETILDI